MAHKYDNFDDAFADLCAKHSNAKDSNTWAYLVAWEAYQTWLDADFDEAIRLLAVAITHVQNALEYTANVYPTSWQQSYFYESIYWANKDAVAPELTWRSICESLVADDFEGKYWFIAIIDRMRQLIWDKPFQIKWAANPKEEQG